MSVQKILLIGNEIKEIHRVGDQIIDEKGQIISEKETQGFNHILRSATGYNAALLATLTNTPIHFWKYASAEIRKKVKEQIMPALALIVPNLQEIREQELKKIYVKRSRRAVNARIRKNQEINE